MLADSKPIIDQGSSPAGETNRPRRVTRQFRVTHTATEFETYVNVGVSGNLGGRHYMEASTRSGCRYPNGNCTIALVPRGEEIPLPFDALPLVIRRQPEPAA